MTIPTTLEMDGFKTPEEAERRFFLFMQCRDCAKWTKIDSREKGHACHHCGSYNFDTTSGTTERSYNPLIKRKVKGKNR